MNILKKIRETTGLSQAEMASFLMVSYSLYQKIENGSRKPTFNFISKFKKKFPDEPTDIFFSG